VFYFGEIKERGGNNIRLSALNLRSSTRYRDAYSNRGIGGEDGKGGKHKK
jgi:hypothetical protein